MAALVLLEACTPSSKRLVNQAIEARGGLERLKAVRSASLSGKIHIGSVEGNLSIDFKRPNQMRMQMVFPTRTVVRLFDGTSGWMSSGPAGHPEFEPMSAVDLSRARREADMDGPLVDSAAKGIRVEPAGKGAVDGRPTDALDLLFSDGTAQRYELDAATHEPVRWEGPELVNGKQRELASTIRATRRVEGVLFPTVIESGPPGSSPTQRINIERIELNPRLDDAWFHPPVAAGPTPP